MLFIHIKCSLSVIYFQFLRLNGVIDIYVKVVIFLRFMLRVALLLEMRLRHL